MKFTPNLALLFGTHCLNPFTDDLKQAIAANVTTICNYDPRVQAQNITVSSYESGIQIEMELTYLPYNISEKLRLDFDESAGLVA